MDDLTLLGYRYSVYTRVVRMVLAEKRQQVTYIETDPFSDTPDASLLGVNPFGRVPVLLHGRFALYETAAITRYIEQLFPDPALIPEDPAAAARMQQVIGIVDSDAYRVLVRQVYSHAVFRPALGEASDPAAINAGFAAAPRILAALDSIAAEGLQLRSEPPSLADMHLAPMIAAFAMVPAGLDLLRGYPYLYEWYLRISTRDSFRGTHGTCRAAKFPCKSRCAALPRHKRTTRGESHDR
jgi:glutathione S-transferase